MLTCLGAYSRDRHYKASGVTNHPLNSTQPSSLSKDRDGQRGHAFEVEVLTICPRFQTKRNKQRTSPGWHGLSFPFPELFVWTWTPGSSVLEHVPGHVPSVQTFYSRLWHLDTNNGNIPAWNSIPWVLIGLFGMSILTFLFQAASF